MIEIMHDAGDGPDSKQVQPQLAQPRCGAIALRLITSFEPVPIISTPGRNRLDYIGDVEPIDGEAIRLQGMKNDFLKFCEDYKPASNRRNNIQQFAWRALTEAPYGKNPRLDIVPISDLTVVKTLPRPLDPLDVLDENLPTFAKMPVYRQTHRSTGEIAHFIKTDECDGIDIDGLARYIIAAARESKRLIDEGIVYLHKGNPTKKFRNFIPRGLSFSGMELAAAYSKSRLADDADSPVAGEELANSTEILQSINAELE